MSRRSDHDNAVLHAISLSSIDLLGYFEYRVGRDDAPDLLAETMTTAWRRSADLPSSQVEARMWLYGIARNVLANAERGGRRRWRLANKLRALTTPQSIVGVPADAGIEIRDAVDRLPKDQAELVRLIHWDGFTIADAAQLCGIPDSTARSRYQAAKLRLRETLEPDRSEPTQIPAIRC